MSDFYQEAVTIAVITCRRQAGLQRVLHSLTELELPSNVAVSYLVVDNDPAQSARDVVASFHSKLHNIQYVSELRPGIPIARTRAVDEVVATQADFMAFTDDDEVVDRQWLRELVAVQRSTGADLVGGPELGGINTGPLPIWNRFIEASVSQRALKKARLAYHNAIEKNQFMVLTHNWYCRVSKLRDSNLRFDLLCTKSGGSDTVFYNAAKALGWKTAWAPHAIVSEILTPDRLTLRYQLNRGREQSIANFTRNTRKRNFLSKTRVVVSASVRLITGTVLLIVPVKGLASPVIAVRSIGWAAGRIQAIMGRKGALYANIVNESDRLALMQIGLRQ